jgi:hypothetical protein
MGVGWTTLVAAEMVAAQAGLGQLVLNASNFLRTDVVLMGILVIGLFAALFALGMRWRERVLVPWTGKQERRRGSPHRRQVRSSPLRRRDGGGQDRGGYWGGALAFPSRHRRIIMPLRQLDRP